MITPPLSIWARPFLVAQVDVSTVICAWYSGLARGVCRPCWPRGRRPFEPAGPPRAWRLSHAVRAAPVRRDVASFPALPGVEFVPGHVRREDRPGECPNRAQLPQAAFAPVLGARLVAGPVLRVAGEDPARQRLRRRDELARDAFDDHDLVAGLDLDRDLRVR